MARTKKVLKGTDIECVYDEVKQKYVPKEDNKRTKIEMKPPKGAKQTKALGDKEKVKTEKKKTNTGSKNTALDNLDKVIAKDTKVSKKTGTKETPIELDGDFSKDHHDRKMSAKKATRYNKNFSKKRPGS